MLKLRLSDTRFVKVLSIGTYTYNTGTKKKEKKKGNRHKNTFFERGKKCFFSKMARRERGRGNRPREPVKLLLGKSPPPATARGGIRSNYPLMWFAGLLLFVIWPRLPLEKQITTRSEGTRAVSVQGWPAVAFLASVGSAIKRSEEAATASDAGGAHDKTKTNRNANRNRWAKN